MPPALRRARRIGATHPAAFYLHVEDAHGRELICAWWEPRTGRALVMRKGPDGLLVKDAEGLPATTQVGGVRAWAEARHVDHVRACFAACGQAVPVELVWRATEGEEQLTGQKVLRPPREVAVSGASGAD